MTCWHGEDGELGYNTEWKRKNTEDEKKAKRKDGERKRERESGW